MLYQTWMNKQHAKARERLNGSDGFQPRLPVEFMLHSLLHTFGTRLGEAGADAEHLQFPLHRRDA